MDLIRIRAPRWIAAGLVVLLAVLIGRAPSGAGTAALDVGDQVVVNVTVRGRGNQVAVRTWDRPSVAIEYGDDAPAITHRVTMFGAARGLTLQIPPQLLPERTPDGGPAGQTALPPEEFPYASFRPGRHDVVALDAPQGARLTVTIPATTGVLTVRAGGGRTTIDGYHGANLVVIQGQGRVQLTNTSTTAFVQMNYGTFYAADDTFERVRVRGIGAHDVFERCRSREIEATSVTGSIVYDGGSFDAGVARFESATGNIALGVTSGAQLTGRAAEGHVYTLFDRRGTPVEQRGDGDATATVGGGGPVVSAITGRGSVFLYDGTLLGHRITSPEWRQVHALFQMRRAPAPPPLPPAPRAHPIERARLVRL